MARHVCPPDDHIPLPPASADVITTACDYCVVACGFKVYRWPVSQPSGGMKANENAFGIDFPSFPLQAWIAPSQYNVIMHKGEAHHIVVIPDKQTTVVNKMGDSSMRGGLLAQKVYNPQTATKDRLLQPLIRVGGVLQPVSWEFAIDIASKIAVYVRDNFGANSYCVKTYSYQYIENTYAITKYALRHLNTANFTFHDTPSDVTSTPGFRDAGFDNFAPSYEDWGAADVLMVCGTDPYETKTILFTQYIMPAIQRGMKTVTLNPRETSGIAYMKKMGGLHIDLYPGTDTLVLGAIARVIMENGWEDSEWINKWVNNKWESNSGFGQGTRNTPWQWRTTWGKFQTNGFADYKKWNLSQPEYEPGYAAKMAGIDVKKIYLAAEMLAMPNPDGTRKKASFGVEKGFYWSNNTGNSNSIASLATICGAGGRDGRMIGRFGGHQRGGVWGGKLPRNKSPEKLPGRRRRPLDVDRWLISGHTRLAHVIGTTWIQAMTGSQGLYRKFRELTQGNPHQVATFEKDKIIATLKNRVDSGGMVVFNQDIYLRDPIGARFADIIFPAATWGEENFTRANGERRLRLYQKFYDAPGEAKPDWWIIAQLASKMGYDGFDWADSNSVAEEAARFSRGTRKDFYMVKVAAKKSGISLHEQFRRMGTEGIQAPVFYNYKTDELVGTKRLHDTEMTAQVLQEKGLENGPQGANILPKTLLAFNTQTGKVNLQKHPWHLFADFHQWMQPKEGELWFTNGRINEIWQSGFDDTQRRAFTMQRWPENWVEIHPEDAKVRGIESGDRVMLYSDRIPCFKDTLQGSYENQFQFTELLAQGHIELEQAAVTAIAMVTPAIKKGVLYSNMLDMRQPTNALTARVVDNVSGNYNFKMGVARVKRMSESPYKRQFRNFSFVPRNIV